MGGDRKCGLAATIAQVSMGVVRGAELTQVTQAMSNGPGRPAGRPLSIKPFIIEGVHIGCPCTMQ